MDVQQFKSYFRRKPVKIISFILLGIVVLFIILLSAVSIYVQHNKPQIITRIKNEFDKRVNGKLTIGDIDLSVWKNFPNIAVDVQNVTVVDSVSNKPLLTAKDIYCAVSVFQLATARPDIAKVTVSGAEFHLFTDSTGFTNTYLLSPKKDTVATGAVKPAAQPIIINHIELENFKFISEDFINHKKFGVDVKTADATLRRRDSMLLITFKEDCIINGLGFNVDKGTYLQNTTVKAKWEMQFDKSAKVLTIQQAPAVINGNDFTIGAEFHFGGDSAYFKLHAVTANILYKDARALLTERVQSKLKFIDIATPIAIDAKLTGKLVHGGDPFVQVVCKAKNTILVTPVATFAECNFTGMYDNRINPALPPGDPNSVVLFPEFTGKWVNIALTGDHIRIDNLSDPTLSFSFKTQCDFSQLDDALNLQNISFDQGTARLSLQYKGPLTTSPSLLASVSGAMHIENGSLTYVPHNLQFTNCFGDLQFSQNNINIQKITCDYKKNHFEVTGNGSMNRLSNAASASSGIVCNIFCPSFNAGDFKTVFSKTGHRKAAKKSSTLNALAGMDNLLDKGDIQLNINADQLVLDNFTAQNANLQLLLQQDEWHVQRASLNFGGGSFMLDAVIRHPGNNFAATGHFNIQNADVHKVFYAFNNFGQDGITSDNLRGTLTTTAALDMQIDDKGAIVPGSLIGNADFSIRNGALINFAPVIAIQEYALKNRDLNNIQFAEIKNNLVIKQNQIIIPRMEIASTAMRIFVDGVYGVINTPTDISIQVPLSNLNKTDDGQKPGNKGLDAKTGPSIYLRAKSKSDGKIKIGLDLFRKFRKGNADTTK